MDIEEVRSKLRHMLVNGKDYIFRKFGERYERRLRCSNVSDQVKVMTLREMEEAIEWLNMCSNKDILRSARKRRLGYLYFRRLCYGDQLEVRRYIEEKEYVDSTSARERQFGDISDFLLLEEIEDVIDYIIKSCSLTSTKDISEVIEDIKEEIFSFKVS